MFSLLNFFFIFAKEVIFMTFTVESKIAQSYAILILAERTTMDKVPNVGNLREIVAQILTA